MLSVLLLPSESGPDTCCFNLSPCNMAAAAGDCMLVFFVFFFSLFQNQTDLNTSAVTLAATAYLHKATARRFNQAP